MIYKEFVAEAAQKIMAQAIGDIATHLSEEELNSYARSSVHAAGILADELEQDWKSVPVDNIHRFGEKEEFFDNYVNWTQNR